MILIADSGGTKCHWAAAGGDGAVRIIRTDGINPVTYSAERIGRIIADELLPQLPDTATERMHFYGAGCIPHAAATEELAATLARFFPSARIEVASDMLGAARALCGRERGVACILGTGSNSALYDGERLTANVPPLGYILGDEGGGAHIGRTVIADALKGLMPAATVEALFGECGTSYAAIIENVYRRPDANRYLASFMPFIARHSHLPEIRACIDRSFDAFIERNLLQYDCTDSCPVHFTGGTAAALSGPLAEALHRHGLRAGRITASPIEGMIEYHISQTWNSRR